MNYIKIYLQLIEKAQNRDVINVYTEKHHIIPKCLGGNNNENNLVVLTGKEHYIAHHLLLKIYPENKSIYHAFWMMSNRFKINSKDYEDIKRKIVSNMRKNVGTKEAIKKMSNSKKGKSNWIGKKHSKESKKKMSKSARNRNISEKMEQQRRSKISKAHKNKLMTEEHIQNISKSKKGVKNPMYGKKGKEHHSSKPVLQYSLDEVFMKEWSNAREVSELLNLSYTGIHACASGKTKTSGKFIWRFKKEL